MNDKLISTFLCQQIIALGFKVEQKAQLIWVRDCLNSFRHFWQTQNIPTTFKSTNETIMLEIDADELDLMAYISINKQKDDHFSATFQNLTNNNKDEFLLRHESHSHHQPQLILNYSFNQNDKQTARNNFTNQQLSDAID